MCPPPPNLKVAPRSLIILIQLLVYSSLRTSSSRFLPPHSSKILPDFFIQILAYSSQRFLTPSHQGSCLIFIKIPAYPSLKFLTPHPVSCLLFIKHLVYFSLRFQTPPTQVPNSSSSWSCLLFYKVLAYSSLKFQTPPYPGSCFIFIKDLAYSSLKFRTPPHPGPATLS